MFDVNSMYTLYRDFLHFSRHSDACNLLKFYTKMYMLYNIIIAPKVLTIVSIILLVRVLEGHASSTCYNG